MIVADLKNKFQRDVVVKELVRNQFGRRNLTPYQRAELALKLEPLIAKKAKEKKRKAGGAVPQKSAEAPIETRGELAKVAGVSRDTIAKVKLIAAKAPEKMKEQLRKGEVSINAAAKELRSMDRREQKQTARRTSVATVDSRILVGDIREVGQQVADASVDLIFTDPPYLAEYYRRIPRRRASPLASCTLRPPPDSRDGAGRTTHHRT